MQKILGDFDLEITEKRDVAFSCNCSKKRMERALISLGKKEIGKLIEEKEDVEINCHFCNSHYVFSVEELEKLERN